MIYFIQAREREVKVGYTAGDAGERLGQLQTANAHPLQLIDCLAGDRQVEREAHRRLKRKGFHLRGEWFAIDRDTIAWLWGELAADGLVPW